MLERFGVSMDAKLLEAFDRHLAEEGYANRSEALRDLIRDHLVKDTWASGDAEVYGSLTLMYDHHVPQVTETLNSLQHAFSGQVICSLHVHVDPSNCLEVIVLHGKPRQVQQLAKRLLAARGVKHGELTITALPPCTTEEAHDHHHPPASSKADEAD